MPMPSAAFSAISCLGPVVVAGQRDVAAGDAVEQRAAVRNARPLALRLQFEDAAFDGVVVQSAATPQCAIEVEIGVLADARAVVHQADHAHQRVVGDSVEQRQHVQRRHLAAQVQEVLGLQQVGAVQRIEIDHAVLEGADALLVEAEIAEAERVEHRGDAGGGALRIMRDHGGARRPARQRARLHLALQVVGVDIDDAGDQVVAVQVARGKRRGAARLHIGDACRRAPPACRAASRRAAPGWRW